MVLQTKLVDTNSLTDLCKQLLEVRKTDLSDEKLVTSLKSWIKKLDGEKDQEKHKTCFKSMCIGLFTHLIENKNVELTILEELHQCYEKSSEERSDDEPFWSDVITDIIISLLSTASTNVVKSLISGFRSISHLITQDSIDVIADNLLRTNSIEEGESDDEQSDEEESNDGENEENDDEEEPTEIEKFRAKLSSILGPDVQDEDCGADDEEMLKLDDALSEAFKEKMGSMKKEKTRVLKLTDDFKCRVLSVYATILKRRQVSINFILPILPVIMDLSKKNTPLGEKCVSVLNEISTVPVSKIDCNGVHEEVGDVLNRVISESFEMCINPKSGKRQQVMAQMIIWTSKLAKCHNLSIPDFAEGLMTYWKKSISKSHKFNHSFFEGLVERDESVATLLQNPLIECIFDDSIKIVNRAPSCQILNLALKRGATAQEPKELLQKCSNEVAKMLNSNEKLNILIFAGFISIIGTLKSHKNYGLEVPTDLIHSLKNLDKKTKIKMPKSGQKNLRNLLKGTGEPSGKEGHKEKTKKIKRKDRKRKIDTLPMGDEKLMNKKKLIKK